MLLREIKCLPAHRGDPPDEAAGDTWTAREGAAASALPCLTHQISGDRGRLFQQAENRDAYLLRQTQHPAKFRGCPKHGREPAFITPPIIAGRFWQRNRSGEKGNQRFARQTAAAQSKRNAVSDEGIHEGGGVPNHQNSVALGLRLAKDERRGTHGSAAWPPFAAAFLQPGMASENLRQRIGHIGSHHGTGVDPSRCSHFIGNVYRLNSAIPALEEIKIHGSRWRTLSEVSLKAKPLRACTRKCRREIRPAARSVDQRTAFEFTQRSLDQKWAAS